MKEQAHTNRLIEESSPYLLQHAYNPVDWYPWGEEALEKARKENKPILVSIGYAACHWCHVMERESFEDEETARIMNEHFVNIKIDREERPDLDHIYMDAVQALTGSGGWPLNVFLTPDGKPFYGGTYFPPRRAFNRPSWTETLVNIKNAFYEKRHEVDAQAENLTEHLVKSNAFGINKQPGDFFDMSKADEMFQNIMKSADKEWGGFGKAPKFPQTFSIQFLLRYAHVTGNKEAFEQALLSIDKMIDGGIYDQVGGGFARYSTDTEWLVPHFEKMLYDNALLITVISEALQVTGNQRYRQIIVETIEFLKRELLHPDGGFYAALDADSEGEEGRFYVWTYQQVQQLLGNDADLFCSFFDITPAGNWSEGRNDIPGKNILRRKESIEQFCDRLKISQQEAEGIIEEGKKKLLSARSSRIRPITDDKVLLGWNALINTALCKAFVATGVPEYRNLAQENMEFLLGAFFEDNKVFHTWKNGQAKYPAFLDDLSFLIQALIQLQEVTGRKEYLFKAKELTKVVIGEFEEQSTGFFYFTGRQQKDVIVRKKEVYDGATPSGNAVMAINLYKLSLYFDIPEWKERSTGLLAAMGTAIIRYPTSFGNWAMLFLEILTGTSEIAVIGSGSTDAAINLLQSYIPHRILLVSDTEDHDFPLLKGKKGGKTPVFYLCRDYTCKQPVTDPGELMKLLEPIPKN